MPFVIEFQYRNIIKYTRRPAISSLTGFLERAWQSAISQWRNRQWKFHFHDVNTVEMIEADKIWFDSFRWHNGCLYLRLWNWCRQFRLPLRLFRRVLLQRNSRCLAIRRTSAHMLESFFMDWIILLYCCRRFWLRRRIGLYAAAKGGRCWTILAIF